MMQYILLSAVAGLLIPLQALINARLATFVSGPLNASIASFSVGLAALLIFNIAGGMPLPWLGHAAEAPLYAWAGGLLGAFFVATTAIVVVKLGTATMSSIIIACQLIGALMLDHYGVLHPAQPVSPTRLLGVVFLLAGVYLVMQPKT